MALVSFQRLKYFRFIQNREGGFVLKYMLLISMMISGVASAETMSCVFQVIKAKDLSKATSDDFMSYSQIVKLKIEDGEIDQTETINGEHVVFSGFKYEHVDMYNLTAMVLKNPNDGIMNALAVDNYSLYNNGPLNVGDYSPDIQAGSVAFDDLHAEVGKYTISRLFQKELVDAGMWGMSPFDQTTQIAGTVSFDKYITALKKLKNIKPDDVVMVSKLFSCTYNK